jgi:hypothetical protein
MSIPIIEQIRDYLQRHGPASGQTVAEDIPELDACGGMQRAHLLMRLDPCLELTKAGLWAVCGLTTVTNDEKRVQEVALKYFSSIKRPGAPLSSTVEYIHQEAEIDPPEVREMLEEHHRADRNPPIKEVVSESSQNSHRKFQEVQKTGH